MARIVGDVKPTISRGRGRGSWGGTSRFYDDGGKASSKTAWERFEERWNTANDKKMFLLDMSDPECYGYIRASVMRYGLYDIAIVQAPGYTEWADSRAHRLVEKTFDEELWVKFHTHLVEGYNRHYETIKKEDQIRAEKNQGEREAYIRQQKAEQIKLARDEYREISQSVDQSIGMFESDLSQTFRNVEREGDDGEWISDPVDVLHGENGWGYSTKKAKGIKLQITVSLDLSNSMVYNGCAEKAGNTYRDLGFLLKAMQAEHPEDLFVSFFTFSGDSYWSDGAGKEVSRLEIPAYQDGDEGFGEFDQFRSTALAKVDKGWNTGIFTGTDTWLYPLFEQIQKWEKDNSDPGAIRLDVILTDAVVEHKVDIKRSDVIQEQRDGTLSSVFLNFIPEKDWIGSTLPKRSYQIPVTVDTVSGILRNILAEFVAVNA